jgi:hypothetical protein
MKSIVGLIDCGIPGGSQCLNTVMETSFSSEEPGACCYIMQFILVPVYCDNLILLYVHEMFVLYTTTFIMIICMILIDRPLT